MSDTQSDLADLRRHIDEIDERLHDLLIERAEVVARVAARKNGGAIAFYQPAREAQILRRLAARHRGALALASVVRIWRELLAATVRLETQFAVAVFAAPESPGLWDLARDHYGSHTPISACRSTEEVIRAVTEGHAAVGILPMPQEGDPDPWWRQLLTADDTAPQVVARLPFGARGNARRGGDALVIGRGAQHQTGADRTLLAAETVADIGRARLLWLLASLDLNCTFVTPSEDREGTVNLIEIEGFAPLCDPRLVRFRAELGPALLRLVALGGYAQPLPAAALSTAAKG